ncbi:MAG: DUF2911 domain-containing protein [Cyclobacteriaceae bacterium]
MIKKANFVFTLICLAFLAGNDVLAQEALKPRPSPLELVTMKYDDIYVKITYGRPHKKGRDIFGKETLVPYGEVWRTGANEATEITITGDIKMADNEVKAGTYTLFTIPEKDSWTIILNSELGQWGAYNYNQDFDVLSFTVPATSTDMVYEPFTIEFEQHDHTTNILMMWDQTKVEIPIEFPE